MEFVMLPSDVLTGLIAAIFGYPGCTFSIGGYSDRCKFAINRLIDEKIEGEAIIMLSYGFLDWAYKIK
ncbi:hypothetical protein [Bacillus sp. MUM 13]|uniref:hypothetical protein n=1 Tax=Bacillus sp. MUM 13 TaxID=1678001 RepID=UPI001113FF8A|nr:hypothetical protein [Bacillus sp. MUM 13]